MYDPNFKKDTKPSPIEKKQGFNPNYYPPNYVPNYVEDTPPLVNNLVAHQPKQREEENHGEDTKEE